MKIGLEIELIGIVLLVVGLVSSERDVVSFQVAFISPANSDQEIELNYRVENLISGFRVQNGWRVEAHSEHTFNFYFIANSSPPTVRENTSKASTTIVRKVRQQEFYSWSPLMQFYVFFTLNPITCDDYLEHTHIPVLIEPYQQTRRGLFKAHVSVTLGHSDQPYYICLSDLFDLGQERKKRDANNTIINNASVPIKEVIHDRFHHQGNRVEVSVLTYDRGLSSPTKVLIYVCLILLNSIFNGLNIGLMSLSISELEMIIKTSDSAKERKYARNILPLRRHGNFLLCSILLSITLTSSVSVLLLDDLIQGFFAGLISTVVLCIFGEISPQAMCSRYALFIGSHTRKLTYLFMGLTCICSWPLSKIVDWALGKELPIEYSRDALKYLIRKSIDLKDKQCEIITGALEFKDRHIKDIMMPLDRVFMISANEKLDFETMAVIYSSGFSRIPVYDNVRNDIIGWFHVKDLSLIDSNDKLSVRTLVQLCKHKVAFCYTSDTLSAIFELFRHGSTHLAFVLELVQNADTDPYESCVGIVTMHDIIEALLQFEIIDEAVIDRTLGVVKESATAALGINYLKKLIDSHKQRRYNGNNGITNNNKSCESFGSLAPMISLQTKFILSQILNNLKPFREEFMDKSILEKIIMNEQNYFHRYKNNIDKWDENTLYLYRYNQPSDYFVLLLSGSYLIEAGADKIELLAKQYDHYGEKALLGDCTTIEQIVESNGRMTPYVPEYSLKLDRHQASEAPYTFLLISRDVWLSAVKSTYFRRLQTT